MIIRIPAMSILLLTRLGLLAAATKLELKINKTLPEIIGQFPNFDFIIHFDDTTKAELDLLLNIPGINHPVTLLVNYDGVHSFNRPVGYQFVNIVYMEDPFRFGERLKLKYNDVVIFVLDRFKRESRTTLFWKQKGLNQTGCVIVYDRYSGDFYYVHFYVGSRNGLLNKIPVKADDGPPRLLDYVNTFKDFKGHVFNVGYFNCPPFVTNVRCDEPDKCKSDGIDSTILNAMSSHLNFRFHLSTCTPSQEGKWTAMINDVHSRRMDWAIGGITRTITRMELVDFTSMLHMESYAVLYAEENDAIKSWDNALTPLKTYVWVCAMTLTCFIGALLKLASVLLDTSTKLNILMPFRTLSEQPIHLATPSFCAIKILLGTWFLTSIIITTAYKSKLASSMITTVSKIPDSILDLYNVGYSFQTDPDDWTVLRESLSEAYDTRYHDVLSRSKNDLGFCEAIKKVFDEKVAFVDEEMLLQYAIWRRCKGYFTVNEMTRLRKVRQELLPSMHAWPVQQTAPYRFKFSDVFNRLVASGMIEYWYKSNKGFLGKRKKVNATKSNALTITTFWGPAFTLFTGVVLSGAVFLCELICVYNHRR